MSELLSKRALTKKENVPDRFDPEGTPTWTMSRGQVAIEIAALEAKLEAMERVQTAAQAHVNAVRYQLEIEDEPHTHRLLREALAAAQEEQE